MRRSSQKKGTHRTHALRGAAGEAWPAWSRRTWAPNPDVHGLLAAPKKNRAVAAKRGSLHPVGLDSRSQILTDEYRKIWNLFLA